MASEKDLSGQHLNCLPKWFIEYNTENIPKLVALVLRTFKIGRMIATL